MRLIDADKLEANMYHEAFETDTDMQKWDSGCWIRYKMFENQIEKLPTVEAIPIEWARNWAMKNWVKSKKCEYDIIVSKMIDDWREENEAD